MNIVFSNKGLISLIDMTTMGDSSKREDASKIGKFDSGLKYALAIFFRHNIEVTIRSGEEVYTFNSVTVKDNITNKVKEVLTINDQPTAFSPQMGHEWKLWMAYRELYANCIDEQGDVVFISDEDISEYLNSDDNDTHVVVGSCAENVNMISNWNKYFLNKDDILYEGDDVSIYKGDGKLKLYKNGMLVHYEDTISTYTYDYKNASIDEMRLLNNKDAYESKISQCICYCEDIDFIGAFIKNQDAKSYEARLDYYCGLSDQWYEVIRNIYDVDKYHFLNNYTHPSLFKNIKEDANVDIGIKRVSYGGGYSWNKVDVKIEPEETKDKTFKEKVLEICALFNYQVNYDIVESEIKGFACVADTSKKVIYVTKDFNDENMWQMIKSVCRMESGDSDYIYKQHAKLLRK